MKIAFYCPNTFSTLFIKYIPDIQFIFNKCEKNVDFIYSASLSTLQKAIAASQIFNKQIICWVWDLPDCWRNWLTEKNSKEKYVQQSIEYLKQCKLVFSASKSTQKTLLKYNISSEQLYFYIDISSIDKTQFKKKYDAVQISRFYPSKRFEMTISTLKDYKLACVGFGRHYANNLKNNAGDNISFFIDVTRKVCIDTLKQSKILVSPSIFEGFGLTPIEAIYCDVPILLSDLEVFKEIYGDNIIYHRRDNSIDMKEKFEYLLNDKDLQTKIVANCKSIISKFEPEKFAKRWRKIIDNV